MIHCFNTQWAEKQSTNCLERGKGNESSKEKKVHGEEKRKNEK